MENIKKQAEMGRIYELIFPFIMQGNLQRPLKSKGIWQWLRVWGFFMLSCQCSGVPVS